MTQSGRRTLAIACGIMMSVAALGGAQLSSLQVELDDVEIGGGWLYGDLDGGFAQAKETGQPLFVLFR